MKSKEPISLPACIEALGSLSVSGNILGALLDLHRIETTALWLNQHVGATGLLVVWSSGEAAKAGKLRLKQRGFIPSTVRLQHINVASKRSLFKLRGCYRDRVLFTADALQLVATRAHNMLSKRGHGELVIC